MLAKNERVQPGLNAIAKSLRDSKIEVRLAALSAAAGLRDSVVPQLVLRALKDPSPRVRLSAARFLLRHKVAKTASRKVIQDLVDSLCGRTTKSLSLCHQAAAQAAGWGDVKSSTLLVEAAKRKGDPAQRRAAIALALPLSVGERLAIELLSDSEMTIRLTAAAWILRQSR